MSSTIRHYPVLIPLPARKRPPAATPAAELPTVHTLIPSVVLR